MITGIFAIEPHLAPPSRVSWMSKDASQVKARRALRMLPGSVRISLRHVWGLNAAIFRALGRILDLGWQAFGIVEVSLISDADTGRVV